MRLLKLKIQPLGPNGWRSEELVFAEDVTQLFGPNGIGKSPLIKAAISCLGYPSKFREDIQQNCRCAELEFEVLGTVYTARRFFSSNMFHVELVDSVGHISSFYNELDYSRFIFKMLGVECPALVATGEKATYPYFSMLLPIFYLDQDEGYRKFYSPPGSFIKDQLSEILRLILGLPPKNLFDAKKELIEAKRELELWDRNVYSLKKEYEAAQKVHGGHDQLEIGAELESLYSRLEHLKSSSAGKTASTDAIDEIIKSTSDQVRVLSREISDIEKRKHSYQQIHGEIQTEINTLSLNEEAKLIFSSFKEICGSASCQLFSVSSEAYGKNLLYLKDQLKDLERNLGVSQIRSDELTKQRDELVAQVTLLGERRSIIAGSSEIRALVEAITQITSRIFELERVKKDADVIKNISDRYAKALNEQNNAVDRREELSSTGQTNPQIVKFRTSLKENMLKWLDILDTNNVSSNITFQDDFTPVLGSEVLSQLGGSTRIRVILAYHAALLECFCEFDRNIIKFIILDTPKQHEMHGVDLGRYLSALKVLSRAKGIQIIISGTEYRYTGDSFDLDWLPKFPGRKLTMYLEQLK
ncbi:hypothetical protein ACQKP7_15055 [Pseudomonas frederiksbergensis]|uniref:hypothetical protein n=1 Tax=Pseudomonas frederiksbergensis TaxID=104087 RepID=UPI003D0692B8